MYVEYWAHRHYEDPKLKEEVVDEDLTEEEVQRLMDDPDAWEDVFKT